MKQNMKCMDPIPYEDILGLPNEVSLEEMKSTISPVLENLITNIGDKILELNGEVAPNAVFCVGGGSEMFGVTERLADYLKLLQQRVATRSTEHLVKVIDEASIPNSPDMITPLG